MKKLFSALLIFILILQLQTVSFAVSSISDMSVDYNPANTSVNVLGEISSAKKGMLLTLRILSNDVPVGVAQTVADDSGKFVFETILLSNDLSSGTLYAGVSSADIDEQKISFEYYSITEMFGLLKQISDASKIQDFDSVMSGLSEYGAKFGVDYGLYSALATDAKDVFEAVFFQEAYDLNAYDSYPDDASAHNAFEENLTALLENYEEAIMLAQFSAIETKAAFDLWINKYESAFDATKTTDYYTYYQKAVSYSEQLANHLYNHGKECLTIEDAVNKVYECSILTLIEVKQHSVVKELFTKFTELLNIDEEEFDKLTSSQKSKIYPKLAGNFYKTAEEAVNKFNEYIYSATGSTGNAAISKPTGGGGGGGGGSWGASASSPTVSIDVQPEPASVFKDIDTTNWAYKAVKYLYDKNIVNGSGDKKFNPDSNVTRAEFIKMLVCSVDGIIITQPDGVIFEDVDNNEWYAVYVNAAKTYGITTGDNEGNFNPNGKITRQDMAVMLARAFSVKASGKATFNDMNIASDYAVDSIDAMYSSGYIKGSGDGKFNPLSNATRAEAAQMLYNILATE